ncbi:DUF2950 domain-containing protein [Caballeronia sp. LZ016]|uniref:DUF2950 domain-containing protein n=1 Tax=Caballeronia sp. LZ016 TaxID=3038554 RepID=UPI00285F55FE|nr:DUF2950 domain-containing protein [Caballeronia sp. LZ016]MDR5740916.1 DUF2950 domain-containing protein [Caballeronia sp. LZ016]
MNHRTVAFVRAWMTVALSLSLLLPLHRASAADQQRTFATPEEAVGALEHALQSNDDDALIAIFGEAHKRLVVTSDEAENRELRANALRELKTFHALVETSPDRRILRIGDEAWPMPIPLVREHGAWRFATEEGAQEVLDRRIGANEREAIKVLRAYLDAQREYATRDRMGDGVLQYARKLGSSPGKQDGLYWPADPARGEEASPFGPLIAASSHYFKDRKPGDAYHGYHFRILTRQGKNAPGGAFSYLINGRMLAGFAMAAYPAQYGESGVMTFIVNNNGVVYQKNRGASAPPLTEFDPDASWTRVQDP